MADMLSTVPNANPTHKDYDEVPYESHPFAQTHPERLFTVGTLFGMRPTPVQRCRVLELGCAAGGNLLPMADYLPDSEFIGLDLSKKQIDDGQELAKQFGLKNLKLKHANITDVGPDYGQFDYIICHGVFSWVPDPVRDKILAIAQKQLTPNGILYVSYNTYPGWHMRGMIRDMMRYHSNRFNTPTLRTQQARALLDFLSQSVRQDGSAFSVLLKTELETLRTQADHYLYHEHLEENNNPLYFHQFADLAKRHGLKYLGEARVGTMVTGNFGPEIEKTLKMLATDQIQAEQYMDFLRNRMFRETLLCLDRVNPNWAVNPESLRVLHVASGARPVDAQGQPLPGVAVTDEQANVSYRSGSGMSMATTRPLLKAVMQVLNNAFPATVPFDLLRKESPGAGRRGRGRPQADRRGHERDRGRAAQLLHGVGPDRAARDADHLRQGGRGQADRPGHRPRPGGQVAGGDQPPARGRPPERPGQAPGAAAGRHPGQGGHRGRTDQGGPERGVERAERRADHQRAEGDRVRRCRASWTRR